MKNDFSHELAQGMHEQLMEYNDSLSKAGELLHSALEIFESQGLNKQAQQVLSLMAKITKNSGQIKQANKTTSLNQLMKAGISQRDLREFAKSNPMAVAKVNLTLRKLGFNDNEIKQTIGLNNFMSEDKANKAINPNHIESALTTFAQINDRHTKGLTPERMVKNLEDHGHPMNLAHDGKNEKLPSDYEACGICDFDHGYEYEGAYKAHKKLENEENRKKRKLKAEDLDPDFKELLDIQNFDIDMSDDELMGLEIKDDSLEVFDASDEILEDFEDERD